MMKSGKLSTLAAAALAATLVAGLGGCSTTGETSSAAVAPGALCDGCGEVKGTAQCCAEGMETCSSCGKHKGSPGCCK